MNVNAQIPQQWWERLRWTRNGFLAGLIMGVGIGWFFHGLISFVVRFGLVLLLILPLLVIGWFWLRSSRSARVDGSAGGDRRVVTWTSGNFPSNGPFEPFVDVPTGRSGSPGSIDPDEPSGRSGQRPEGGGISRPIPTDVEFELRELKREGERRR